jgi:hypothetical protein
MTVERDIWAMALWVEKNHGGDGERFIAERIKSNAIIGAHAGVAVWRAVKERLQLLREGSGPPS